MVQPNTHKQGLAPVVRGDQGGQETAGRPVSKKRDARTEPKDRAAILAKIYTYILGPEWGKHE